ncbi:hypothetical protein, partial [Flavihumibacter petaseus]
ALTLPASSIEGINGTWSPAINNTATTTYTFTPAAGQCANSSTLTVTVNQPVTPTFAAIPAICAGDPINLLTTSTNGITGTWSPAINNTATTTYTFTPAVGQCANTTTLTVTVNQPVTPTFAAIPAICSGDAFTLPASSTEGITGTWTPAINNTATTTYTFTPAAGQCANTTTLTVTINQPVTPTFAAIPAICSGDALTLPASSTEGINGTWSPAINNTATTTYTFTPAAGQCANTTTLTVTVNQPVTPTFAAIPAICAGDALTLPASSTEGITGTWTPAINNTATTTYTFTPAVGQCANTTTLTVTVNQPVTPTFAAIPAICAGDPINLLNTSTNGITGTWTPAINNAATTTYTFTPAAGQCANTNTLTVTVNQPVTPTFAAIPAICSGDALTLPASSTEGITGTWSPAINNTATTTYTFTPAAGQCANSTTLTVTVNQPVTPTFAAIPAICSGDALTLPALSTEGITGTWSPAINNTATTTYTFTPAAGQCANTATLTVTVNQPVTPTFAAIPAICAGDPINLLTTSTNGIPGTWSPAINNTATTTYTFTPAVGQCANTTTLTVTVNQPVTPTFAAIPAICAGDALTLPASSTEGIPGTWSPAINNTATTTYTFTPAAGQCANTTTLTVTVNQPVTPTFAAIPAICAGEALTLPASSTEGIPGTWSPAINNTATTTYTFTPAVGQCANTTTLTVTVTQPVTPTFAALPAICAGDALTLPASSTEGITGTWTPAINNTATTTYTFTPAAGQCANTTTLTVTVTQPVTPTFAAIPAICAGDPINLLTTSTNGITGTWTPAINNTATTTYTFTPAAGQCANTTTLTVTVTQSVTPTFAAIPAICSGDALTLPASSTEGITGTWTPAINNTATTTYTFTPAAGQCANSTTLTVTVNQPVTPTFAAIPAICAGDPINLLTTSTNGITGSWTPAINNTATTTYTFTPTAGQCANTTTLTVTVNQPATPTFAAIPAICAGDPPVTLPGTSLEGILGTWSPAFNNTATTTYTFTPTIGQCATTTTMTVTVNTAITPTFAAIPAFCAGTPAPTLPGTSSNGITGTWSPATISNTTSGTYTFTPAAGQCATVTTIDITVDPRITPVFDAIGALCQNSTAPALATTSNNGVSGTWSPATINTSIIGPTTYTFTPAAGECADPFSVVIDIATTVVPSFNAIGPLCINSTAPVLPTTSNNGITGSWNATINTSTAGTTTYTFTPDAGQCGATTSIDVTIVDLVTPAFAAIPAICAGDPAPVFPTASTNGITGNWSPAFNNTATTTYTFTPDAGQCATTTTLTVTVNQPVTPTFTAIPAFCSGTAAPGLSQTSNNGITGTWSPSVISNTASATYTFTPDPGQCATVTTLDVTVSPSIGAVFDPIGSLCQNSTAPTLPTSSNNGVTGNWNIPAINTTIIGTTTYTFTPDAGQCSAPVDVDITIALTVTPTFNAIGPLCINSPAPALPSMSNNGIIGTWSPTTVTTATAGTTTYTFTPDAGQCGAVTTLSVTVTDLTIPSFAPVAAICQGDAAPVLSGTSLNGITGSWSPAVVSNTASGTYTFTPAAGQCADITTLDVTVTPSTTPTFDPIGAICQNGTAPALPAASLNGVSGSWNPSVINTSAAGTTTYTFTPAAGQCAVPVSVDITISSSVTPVFTAIGPLCVNSPAPTLPASSNNGINGTWNPATINTSTIGTTTYTFTPDAASCGVVTSIDITITNQVTPNFTAIPAFCAGSPSPVLPATSLNGITGTWSPAIISNTASGTYTFTPDAGQCAAATSLDVTVTPATTPAFDPIGALCQNSAAPALPTLSTNGINGTWSPAVITTTSAGTTTYTFTPAAGECANPVTLDITVLPQTSPTFDPIGAICQNATAPALPTTSLNGVNGIWSPAVINTATAGTATYTFTPAIGECATPISIDITISLSVTPVFNAIGPLCLNSPAPILPGTSNNGIGGTWNPTTVNTGVVGTTTYTFTPDAASCGVQTTIDITITDLVTPTFDPIGAICQNGVAPALPATSLNGVNGTWSPAAINTATVGTSTYTFTPAAGECAAPLAIDVTITGEITPTFNAIPAICEGAPAPLLPSTSLNGITGNWLPAVINTTTSGTYSFIPDAGQCAAIITIDITVTPLATPTFNPIGAICQNGVAPALPATSLNGVNGTWSPAVINTTTVSTTTYTFTPAAGECAAPV